MSARTSLSRRSFLKAAATAGAVAGSGKFLETAAFADQAADGEATAGLDRGEEIFPGICEGYCNNGCYLNLHVKDGVLVRTSARDLPDNDYKRICQKGYTHPMRVYSSERVLYPLRRVGERGSGEWEQITWDEAIQEIATKWQAIADEYGWGALSFTAEAGTFSLLGGDGYPFTPLSRFTKILGMTNFRQPVDAAVPFIANRMVGNGYFHSTNEPKDMLNSKTIFIWGANPSGSQTHTFHFITEARERGAKVVVVDPVFNANAAILADKFVPLKPATDGALAFGMMNVIIENGWQDLDFIRDHTCAPFLVNPDTHAFMRLSDLGLAEAGSDEDAIVVTDGEGNFDVPEQIASPMVEGSVELNGVTYTTAYSLLLAEIEKWPVAQVSEITGVPEEDIVEIAQLYACETPTYTYCFFGTDHYYNGHWNSGPMFTLALLTGNMGRPGSGCGISATTSGSPFLNTAAVRDVESITDSASSIFATKLNEVVNDHTYNGNPFELHGLFVSCANPVGNRSSRTDTLEAFDKLDSIVVADMYMSETAAVADIVLPVCYWFEHEDVMCCWIGHPHIMHHPQALTPLGESKSDFDIYKLILEAMGLGDRFDLTTRDFIEMLLDSDACHEMGITYDKLVEQGAMRAVPSEEPYVFAKDGVFPTATGRANFYIEKPAPTNDYAPDYDFDKEYLPYWEPPMEVPLSAVDPKYPFQLIGEHSRYRTHTQWFDVDIIREIDPEQFVYINTEDAAALGIASGDEIKVSNDRGYLVAHAVVRPNNQPGILSVVKGWTNKQVIDGHYSNLTPLKMNPFCANQPFNDNAVMIEKL